MKLLRFFLRLAALLAVLAAFAILDWYPTVKGLGRLRRDRSDLERKIREYRAMADRFVFSDAREQSLFSQNAAWLRRSLPQVETDADWLDRTLSALVRQVRADRSGHAFFLVSPGPGSDPTILAAGEDENGLKSWLAGQRPEMLKHFRQAVNAEQFPWHSVLTGPAEAVKETLASRPLLVVLRGGGELLDFINHCSWSDARLEIVHVHLDAKDPVFMVWMICRGQYIVRSPSPWAIANGQRGVHDNLLIDPDSPLLWQKVAAGCCPQVEKKELAMPSAGSR